jgi:hypothetical protein
MRFPSGVGDREPTPEDIDKVVDPKSLKPIEDRLEEVENDDGVTDFHDDPHTRASLAMAVEDQHVRTSDDDPYFDSNPGHTQYDVLMKKAQDDPDYGRPVEIPGIEIQDAVERGDFQYHHKEASEREQNFFRRLMNRFHLRKDRHKNKRG